MRCIEPVEMSNTAFLSTRKSGICSVDLNVRSFILWTCGRSSFRKSLRRSLLPSSPKSFLKPKSVYGLMYLAIIALNWNGQKFLANDFAGGLAKQLNVDAGTHTRTVARTYKKWTNDHHAETRSSDFALLSMFCIRVVSELNLCHPEQLFPSLHIERWW